MNFNLLDEDWIPVLYRDGRWERIGIRKALKDAARIRQLAASNPMDRVAILRFLLALLYWCNGNPPHCKPGPLFQESN
jgi:CRISPR system Cascade subunit CasA